MTRLLRQGAGWLLFLCAAMAGAQTVAGGPITADTIWPAAQGPYVVTNDVSVQNGATLTIEAGTIVYMASGTRFTVQSGALKAIGRAESPIKITSQKLQNGQPAAPGDWQQITLGAATMNTTRLEHVQVEYGKGVTVSGASPTFNHVNIKDNQGAAVTIDLAASPAGEGNQASGNTINAIVVSPGDITGTVAWGLKGIPYLIASSTVSVGASPRIDAVSPQFAQRGEQVALTLTGSRLSGLSNVTFEKPGISAQLDGGSATSATLTVTVAPETSTGSTAMRLRTDAGEIRVADAFTVVQQQPKLTALTPNRVYLGQGPVEIILSGTNLSSQSTVLLNDTAIASSYVDTATMRATVPNQAAVGPLSLRLSTPDPLHPGETLLSNELSMAVEQPKLDLSPASIAVTKGGAQIITLTLSYPAHAGGLTVNLASSAPSVAVVPATVVVPEGDRSATIAVTGVNGGTARVSANHADWLSDETNVSVFSASLHRPVADYRLDEASWSGATGEVRDSSANGNHGKAVNGAMTTAAKICAGGLFDGTASRYLTLPAAIQNFAANTFTMMLWVKPGKTHEIDVESSYSTAGVSGQNYALYPNLNRTKWDWDTSGYAGAGISVGTNGVSVYEHAGNYMPPVLVWSGPVAANDWTHVAVTYSNGIPSLYVNGVFRKAGVNGDHANVVPTFIVGSAAYGNYSLGADEYKIFGEALSASDIAAIYANENSGLNWDGSARACGGN